MDKLIIPGRFPSRNEAENAARTHWAKGAKLKKEQTDRVTLHCLKQKIKRYDKPILLTITFYEKDMRRDSDNVYAAIKYIKDGLVKAGVIPNDTRRWVNEIIMPIKVDKDNPRVEVMISEVSDQ